VTSRTLTETEGNAADTGGGVGEETGCEEQRNRIVR
jgi:hypothetical protein